MKCQSEIHDTNLTILDNSLILHIISQFHFAGKGSSTNLLWKSIFVLIVEKTLFTPKRSVHEALLWNCPEQEHFIVLKNRIRNWVQQSKDIGFVYETKRRTTKMKTRNKGVRGMKITNGRKGKREWTKKGVNLFLILFSAWTPTDLQLSHTMEAKMSTVQKEKEWGRERRNKTNDHGKLTVGFWWTMKRRKLFWY